jgi:hypothetical protein
LNGARFDPETTRILGVALEMARYALRFEERGDGTDATIANHIIEFAQAGERNADRLCDYALAKLREADGRSSQLFQSPPRPGPPRLSQVGGLASTSGEIIAPPTTSSLTESGGS